MPQCSMRWSRVEHRGIKIEQRATEGRTRIGISRSTSTTEYDPDPVSIRRLRRYSTSGKGCTQQR